MLETIETHIMDLLAADARTYAGGNAWSAGWLGVKRPDANDAPTAGYVNLFDRPHEPDSLLARPAIYVGMRGMESSDDLEFAAMSGGKIEHRIVSIPLVIAVLDSGGDMLTARRQRNQLRGNIKRVLIGHVVESGCWYDLQMKDGRSPVKSKSWGSGSGQGQQGATDSMAVVVLQIRYTFTANSPS